jgi:hypothetical protein
LRLLQRARFGLRARTRDCFDRAIRLDAGLSLFFEGALGAHARACRFERLLLGRFAAAGRGFGFTLGVHALVRLLGRMTVSSGALERSRFRLLLRFEPFLCESQRLAFSGREALGLRLLGELGSFTRFCSCKRAGIGFGARGRRGFRGAIRFHASRRLIGERGLCALTLLGRFQRLLVGGGARVRRGFGLAFGTRSQRCLFHSIRLCADALARGRFGTLLGFHARACELEGFLLDPPPRFGLCFELELGCFSRLCGFEGPCISFGAYGRSLLGFVLGLRAGCRFAGCFSVCIAAFARGGFRALLGSESSLRELQRLPFGLGSALGLGLRFELRCFARLGRDERARFGFSPRLCGGFGSGIGCRAGLHLLLQGCICRTALVRGLKCLLLLGLARARRFLRAHFDCEPRLRLFTGVRFGLRPPCSFCAERRFSLSALLRHRRKVALGFGARLLGLRGFGFGALTRAQHVGGAGLGFGAFARRLLRIALGLCASVRLLDRMSLGGYALASRGVCCLLGFEPLLRDCLRVQLRFGAYLGLRARFGFADFALLGGFDGLRIRFGARLGAGFGCAVGFEPRRSLLLKLGLGALTRTCCFGRFVVGSGSRLCGFDRACFRRSACACNGFRRVLSFQTRLRLAFEIRFGGSAIALGLHRLLLRGSASLRGLGRSRLRGGARLRNGFGTAIGFAPRSGVLLRFAVGPEPCVSRLDRLLVCSSSRVGCGLRFHLCLLASLCFFDRAGIRCDAALRTQLRLTLHLRALESYASGIAIGFGARRGLRRARAFSCLARAGGRECATLAFGRHAMARLFRDGKCLQGRRTGWQIDVALGRSFVRDAFFRGAPSLLAVALEFAPNELSAAYVM